MTKNRKIGNHTPTEFVEENNSVDLSSVNPSSPNLVQIMHKSLQNQMFKNYPYSSKKKLSNTQKTMSELSR